MTSTRGPVRSIAAASVLHGPTGDDTLPEGPRYERRAEVGSGGVGRVTVAWDRWLGREVALKEARDDAHQAMLLREARVAAQLEHPGILPIHDTGLADDGSVFFAMPLVRGRSLADHLGSTREHPDTGAMLRALLAVAETMAFAHSQGIFHLDLKPANVMLGPYGRTLVIDWGMADGPGLADLPDAPARGGTPRYMSPERARGGNAAARDDVFALGAMLYEVVVGRAAFEGIDDLASAAAKRPPPPWPADRPRALGALVMRALGVDDAGAYGDAAPFARDLARHLDDRPIAGYAYSLFERAVLFVRRWRVATTVAAVALLAVLVVSLILLARVADERDRAEALLEKTLLAAALDEAEGEHRDAARSLALQTLALGPSPEAVGLLSSVPAGSAREEVLGALPCRPSDVVPQMAGVICEPTPGDARVTLWRRDGGWSTGEGGLRDPAFSRGDVLAIADNEYVTFDIATGNVTSRHERICYGVLRPSAGSEGAVSVAPACVGVLVGAGPRTLAAEHCGRGGATAIAVSEDGAEYAIGCDDGVIVSGHFGRDTEDAILKTSLGPPWFGMTALAFVPGTRELVVGTQQGWLIRIDRDDLRRQRMWRMGGLVQRVAMARDGARAVFFGDGGGPLVMDVRAWAPLARLDPDVVAGRFEDDGRFLAAGDVLRRLDFAPLQPRWVALSHGVTSLDVSPDGRTIAIGQAEWLATVDVERRRPIAQASWQPGVIKAVAFDREGGVYAHGILENSAIRFPDARLVEGRREGLPDSLRVVWLEDGSAVVIGWNVGARLWRDGREVRDLQTPAFIDMVGMEVGDGRTFIVGLGKSGDVFLARDIGRGGNFEGCGGVPGARRVALRRTPGGVGVLAVTAQAVLGTCGTTDEHEAPTGDLLSAAADDHYVVAGDRDGSVHVWRSASRLPDLSLRAHAGRVGAVALLPDGRGFVSGGWDGRLFFWSPLEQPEP